MNYENIKYLKPFYYCEIGLVRVDLSQMPSFKGFIVLGNSLSP